MKKIRLKLILSIGFLTAVLTAILLYRTHMTVSENVDHLLKDQLELALNFDLSIREYMAEDVRPLMLTVFPKGEFIPQIMSSSFAARKIFETVRKQFPNAIIKFSSENPRNPANQAGPEEIALIKFFNENPDIEKLDRILPIDGKNYMAKLHVMRMEKKCLTCHGDPADAPKKLIELYGPERSFHLPLGKVVGFDTIAIPIGPSKAVITRETIQNFSVIFVVIVSFFITIALVLRFMVTEQKGLDAALTKSEEKYRTILENIEDGYYEVDLAGNLTFFNDAFCRVLGYSRNELMGMNNQMFMDQENAKQVYRKFNQVFTTGEPSKGFDWKIIRKDGTSRHVNISITLIRDAIGNTTGFRGIGRDVTENRRAEAALRESEEMYRLLTDISVDVIIQVNKNGMITYVSASAESIFGYLPEEVIGNHLAKYLPQSEIPLTLEMFNRVIAGEKIRSYEFVAIRKDGSHVHLDASVSPIVKNGIIQGVQGIARDVTDRVKIQNELKASEEKFRLLTEASADSIYEINWQGKFTYVSPGTALISGYTVKELIGKSAADFFQESEKPKAMEFMRKVFSGEKIRSLEVIARRKEGTPVYLESSALPYVKDGRIISVLGVSRDITARKEAEKALAESQAKYRLIFDAMPVAIFSYDQSGIVTAANPKSLSMFGLTELQAAGFKIFETEKDERVLQCVKTALSGEPCGFEGEYTSIVTGKTIHINSHNVPIYSDDNRVMGGIVLIEDITEKVRAQQDLQETQKNLDTLFNAITESVFLIDARGRFLSLNKTTAERLRSTVDQMLGKVAYDFLPQDIAMCRREKVEEVILTGKEAQIEDIRFGRHVWTNFYPIFDDKGHVIRIAVFTHDIHDRKIAEEALRASEEKYRLIFDSSPTGIVQYNKDGMITDCNKAFSEMLSAPREALKGFNILENGYKSVQEAIIKSLSGEVSYYEGEFTSVISGKSIISKAVFFPVFSPDKTVTGGVVMAENITEQHKAEIALRESEQNLRSVFDAITEALLLIDMQGTILSLNQTMAERLYSTVDVLIGKNVNEYLPPDVVASRGAQAKKVVRSRKAVQFDGMLNNRHRRINIYPVLNAEGRVIRLVVFGQDIHEQKIAQEALQASEERYRLLFESAPVGIGISDLQGNVVECNPCMLETFGYSKEETKSFSLTNAYADYSERERFIDELKRFGQLKDQEVRFKRKNGEILTTLMNLNVVRLEGGSFILAILRDITFIKKSQQAMRESEEKYRLIFDSSPIGFFHYDKSGIITACNTRFAEMIGTPSKTLVGIDVLKQVKDKDLLNAFQNSLSGKSSHLEGKYTSVTGRKTTYGKADIVPVFADDGAVSGGLGVFEDTTVRIKAEKAKKMSEEKARLLLNATTDAVVLIDPQGVVLDLNDTYVRWFQKNKEEIAGKSIWDFFSSEAAAYRQSLLKKAVDSVEPVHSVEETNGRWTHTNIYPLRNKSGKVTAIAIFVRDINSQKQAEDELKESHEKLRNLTKYLQTAREQERTSIARELHDDLGQALTAINFEASWLAEKIPETYKEAKLRADAAADLAVGAIQSLRRIISELRPSLLSDLGLAAAIKWQAEEYQRRIGITFKVVIDPEDMFLDDDLSTAVFRIFQEATTNAVRHSHASSMSVSLKQKDEEVELIVKDNGIGITEDQLTMHESFGIMGMRERAEVLGGKIDISGIPGKGTTLIARFQL